MSNEAALLNTNNYNGFVGTKYFEFFVVFTILAATIITGIRTYELTENILFYVFTADRLITSWFAIEIFLRVYSAKSKKEFLLDRWNIFDIVVIVLLLLPMDGADLASFGRVIRILRILRLISIVPQLKLLTNAFLRSIPQLFYVIVLMFVIFYIYAAVGTTFFSEINEDLWGNIGISMLTLFRVMTFEDWTDVMYETMEIYPNSCFYYISFIFITAFATLNMVIGIMTASLESEQLDDIQDKNTNDMEILNHKIDVLTKLVKNKYLTEENSKP